MADPSAPLTAALSDRYRIERELGEGGMATVYLAEDLKHNRKVAIKVLKPELAAVLGAERFLQEIATTAQLQHPNILPLFDSGTAEGFLYYVMPYIEGETLRARLDRETQLGVAESVKLVSEVADALQYAHEQGVVHRDIKPENILLHAGRPMVADFGIALAVSAAAGGRMTETGLSLGTPHYMSPEQATAEKVISARSDIYSLGSVLYEMLTGQPPHLGGSAQQIIVKIIADPARPVDELRKSVPPNVAAAVAKALEKLPADRFETATGLVRALEDTSFRYGTATAGAVAAGAASRLWKRAALGLAGVSAVLAVALGVVATRRSPAPQVERFAIPQQDGTAFDRFGRILPDGSGMVWVEGSGKQAQIWVRHWSETAGTPVRGTEGANDFLVAPSPDGKEVSFSVGGPGPLKVAPLLGGSVRTLADSAYTGGVWSSDGRFLYYIDTQWGITRVPSGGGDPTVVAKGMRPDSAWYPLGVVPGRPVLLARVAGATGSKSSIRAIDLNSGEVTPLVEGRSPVAVSAKGDLVFGTQDGTLMAAQLDLDEMKVMTAPTVVMEGVGTARTGADLRLTATLSDDGSLLYLPGARLFGDVTPVWVDRQGHAQAMDPEWHFPWGTAATGVSLSPEGGRLAVSEIDTAGSADVWLKELDAGPHTRITSTQGRRPVWSSDGKTVYYLSSVGDSASGNVWERPADASRPPELVLDREEAINEAFPVGDGTFVFRTGSTDNGGTDSDIFLWDPRRDTVTTLVDSDFIDWQATLSPDGKWLAYTSNESGTYEVYVRPFPDTGAGRWPVSVNGGRGPLWSRDGKELFYEDSTSLWSASVQTRPTFSVTGRTRLFGTAGFATGDGHRLYDISPDGKRFVMLSLGQTKPSALILVKNWLSGVEARPGG